MGASPVFRLSGLAISLFASKDYAMNKLITYMVFAAAGLAFAQAVEAQAPAVSRVTPVVLAYRRAKPSVVNISS